MCDVLAHEFHPAGREGSHKPGLHMTERNITGAAKADLAAFFSWAAGNSFSGFRRFFFVKPLAIALEFV
jgi:hypothetical protein